jgi:hypothetical protein
MLRLNIYIKACFTDYIRCQCESIFTVRELREFCGNAFSLRKSRPVPHLKFLIPLPPVPAGPTGLPFGALLSMPQFMGCEEFVNTITLLVILNILSKLY